LRLDRLPDIWLCHADARQVCDLPKWPEPHPRGLRPCALYCGRAGAFCGHRPLRFEAVVLRQVRDLPRISMAEPSRRDLRSTESSDRIKDALPRIAHK
jgi:hypothetical protein